MWVINENPCANYQGRNNVKEKGKVPKCSIYSEIQRCTFIYNIHL